MCPDHDVISQDTQEPYQHALWESPPAGLQTEPPSGQDGPERLKRDLEVVQELERLQHDVQHVILPSLIRLVRFAKRHPSVIAGNPGVANRLGSILDMYDRQLLVEAVANQEYLRTKHGSEFYQGNPHG